jgi:SsrA-binding protein
MKIVNRRAYHDYRIVEELVVGIELYGDEVKSLSKGAASLVGSRVIIDEGEMKVIGMQINPYEYGMRKDEIDPKRTRKLLAKKEEIVSWGSKREEKGLTIVPLECYNQGRFFKLKIALVAGKKVHEKREEEKKRVEKRNLENLVKFRSLDKN